MTNKNDVIKTVPIKEGLVKLTGGYKTAIILQQFIYWSERRDDFKEFIQEEFCFGFRRNNPREHGWIYKTANELSDEIMLGFSDKTMRKYISFLVENNFLHQRNNPKRKWDRTLQYRVNITYIRKRLEKIGFPEVLEDYPFNVEETPKRRGKNNRFKRSKSSTSKRKKVPNRKGKKERAIPENTTDIITDNISENISENSVLNSSDSKGVSESHMSLNGHENSDTLNTSCHNASSNSRDRTSRPDTPTPGDLSDEELDKLRNQYYEDEIDLSTIPEDERNICIAEEIADEESAEKKPAF